MLNPVDVERRFIDLDDQLGGNLSYREQWVLIGDFFQFIRSEFDVYDSHCEQLAERLPVFKHPLSIAGSDPQWFKSLMELLTDLQKTIPSLRNHARLKQARDSLKLSASFLFMCLHELKMAGDILIGAESRIDSQYVSVDKYLASLVELPVIRSSEKFRRNVHSLSAWWKKATRHESNCIFVPVVEKGTSSAGFGRLRLLAVSVLGAADDVDHFRNSYSVVGADGLDGRLNPNVAKATRQLIKDRKSV